MEEIEVSVVREGDEPAASPAAPGAPFDWRRWLVPACAVVVALSAVAIAWSQHRLSQTNERFVCLQEAQLLSFGPNQGTRDRYYERLRACGLDVPDDDDAEEG